MEEIIEKTIEYKSKLLLSRAKSDISANTNYKEDQRGTTLYN